MLVVNPPGENAGALDASLAFSPYLMAFDLRGRNQMATLVVIFGLTPILGIFVGVLAGRLLTDD
jgi:hypothetical protein